MELVGKLHVIGDTQEKSPTFKVRDIVLEVNEDGANGMVYTNYISFQLTNNSTTIIDNFKIGDEVKVTFSIRGRKWQAPSGEVRYFNTLSAFRVEPANMAGGYQQPAGYAQPQQGFGAPQQPAAQSFNAAASAPAPQADGGEDDDLPF